MIFDRCEIGDCREIMRRWIAESVKVQMCVTSPPYWGLRNYGVLGQFGLESTPQEYVENVVAVFRLVRELLNDDGTLWLNLGDSYANDGKWGGETGGKQAYLDDNNRKRVGREKRITGLKPKDLVGIPWRTAFALRADGWWLRQDIIWAKPNPMPESVRDRCTKSHEYLFLLAKSERYYYDAEAIAEPVSASFANDSRHQTGGTDRNEKHGYEDARAQNPKGPHRIYGGRRYNPDTSKHKTAQLAAQGNRSTAGLHDGREYYGNGMSRNKRSVWTVSTESYPDAHFATFPRALIEPCILAGSRPGDAVLDPFMGSGTTAEVAQRLGRRWIGCELNLDYVRLQDNRTRQTGMAL